MVPTDDPLKCPYADEWDKKTLSDAIDNLLWTHGMLLCKIALLIQYLDILYSLHQEILVHCQPDSTGC